MQRFVGLAAALVLTTAGAQHLLRGPDSQERSSRPRRQCGIVPGVTTPTQHTY
jgi:hypothetical protein